LPKILIVNTNCSWNKGSEAQVISVVFAVKKLNPNVSFTLSSFSLNLDKKPCSRYGLSVFGYYSKWFSGQKKNLFFYSIRLLLSSFYCSSCMLIQAFGLADAKKLLKKEKYSAKYSEADLILDLSGDSFTDLKHRAIFNIVPMVPALMLKKPLVPFSQTIGPFSYLSLPLAKLCLKKSSFIVVREDYTRNYLKRIGCDKRMYIAADCAFLLEPASSERVYSIFQENGLSEIKRPIIGISVSSLIITHNDEYLKTLAKLVDYLTDNKDVNILLIPHVISSVNWNFDDQWANEQLYKLLRNREHVSLIKGDYTPCELKGLIGQCDIFIGSRMHANIASLSQGIPTVAIGWSDKYSGIMKRLGMLEYVCRYETVTFDELRTKVDYIFAKKDEIRHKLMSKIKSEKDTALESVKLLCSCIHSEVKK